MVIMTVDMILVMEKISIFVPLVVVQVVVMTIVEMVLETATTVELALVIMLVMIVKVVTVMGMVVAEFVIVMMLTLGVGRVVDMSGRYGVGAGNDGRAVIGNNVKMMVEGCLWKQRWW